MYQCESKLILKMFKQPETDNGKTANDRIDDQPHQIVTKETFKYSKVDSLKEVKEVRLTTRTFRREKITMIPEKERVEIQADDLADYSFYDVEFFIYQKITLKGT